MQPSSMFTGATRPVVAIVGIMLLGIMAAVLLPLWNAVLVVLVAVSAIRIIAAAEPVTELAVIRRDERR